MTMTTTDSPITVSRSRFTTTYEDNEYEITLATVTYSRHERRWHTYCHTSPEDHEHAIAERRSKAEEIALRHAFQIHAAIDQPENLERLLALAPDDPRPPANAAETRRPTDDC